jgi:hypothetical protein
MFRRPSRRVPRASARRGHCHGKGGDGQGIGAARDAGRPIAFRATCPAPPTRPAALHLAARPAGAAVAAQALCGRASLAGRASRSSPRRASPARAARRSMSQSRRSHRSGAAARGPRPRSRPRLGRQPGRADRPLKHVCCGMRWPFHRTYELPPLGYLPYRSIPQTGGALAIGRPFLLRSRLAAPVCLTVPFRNSRAVTNVEETATGAHPERQRGGSRVTTRQLLGSPSH